MKIMRPDRVAIPGSAGIRVYVDLRDWWVGYYRSRTHHYVCPLPTLVVRWRRGRSVPLAPPAPAADAVTKQYLDGAS